MSHYECERCGRYAGHCSCTDPFRVEKARLASPQEILRRSQEARPTTEPRKRDAVVIRAQDAGELTGHVATLGQQGYRIVAVLSHWGDQFIVVAQEY